MQCMHGMYIVWDVVHVDDSRLRPSAGSFQKMYVQPIHWYRMHTRGGSKSHHDDYGEEFIM